MTKINLQSTTVRKFVIWWKQMGLEVKRPSIKVDKTLADI